MLNTAPLKKFDIHSIKRCFVLNIQTGMTKITEYEGFVNIQCLVIFPSVPVRDVSHSLNFDQRMIILPDWNQR
jgi:hypothetical protein